MSKKALRNKIYEEEEKISAIADGTVAQARSILEADEKESKAKKDTVLDYLDSSPKKIRTYNEIVADLLLRRFYFAVDWPKGWTYEAAPTDKGIVFEIKSPDNRIFRNAFKTTGSALFDLNAIDVSCLRAQNTIDRLEREKRQWMSRQEKSS